MPKKSSKKSIQGDGPVVEETKKPSKSPKKLGSEIDEIFAGKKRKKPDNEKDKKPAGDVEASKPGDKVVKKKKKIGPSKENGNGPVDLPSRSRKRTGDGLTIYTEEELGIGKADAGDDEMIELVLGLDGCACAREVGR
ncbi:hypothetical protein M9H77_11097 [Catharanthus roseus]|uniref:Uncharacterized protein n=1 Tax=Catharanthus roseus TaxID=4058 RepID=A0ACC0BDU8_CATRO|nr:hypothetical protein M9H77_11097 [Catharanthus roseus]